MIWLISDAYEQIFLSAMNGCVIDFVSCPHHAIQFAREEDAKRMAAILKHHLRINECVLVSMTVEEAKFKCECMADFVVSNIDASMYNRMKIGPVPGVPDRHGFYVDDDYAGSIESAVSMLFHGKQPALVCHKCTRHNPGYFDFATGSFYCSDECSKLAKQIGNNY